MKTIMRFIFGLMGFVILSSCTDREAQNNDDLAIVQSYIDAVEASDYETMATLLGEGYMGYGPSHNDSTSREQALASWKKNSDELYESIEYLRSRMHAMKLEQGPNSGQWVSNWAELRIHYKDGKGPVIIWANTNYQIREGKIYRSFTFYNEADVLEQLGYVFINPSEL